MLRECNRHRKFRPIPCWFKRYTLYQRPKLSSCYIKNVITISSQASMWARACTPRFLYLFFSDLVVFFFSSALFVFKLLARGLLDLNLHSPSVDACSLCLIGKWLKSTAKLIESTITIFNLTCSLDFFFLFWITSKSFQCLPHKELSKQWKFNSNLFHTLKTITVCRMMLGYIHQTIVTIIGFLIIFKWTTE